MDDEDPVLAAWNHFDLLKQLQEANSPSVDTEARPCEDHICGPRCCFLQENSDGAYTCPLSGLVYGQVHHLGFNDHCILTAEHTYTPSTERTPRSATRRNYDGIRTELFSIAIQSINKLIKHSHREKYAEKKNTSARKSALKQMLAARDQLKRKGGCLTKAVDSIYTTYERFGGGVVPRNFSDRRICVTAETICHLHCRLWIPYSKVSEHRPTRHAFAIACCYIIAEGSLGPKLYDPLMASYLPDQKALGAFGIRVNQITNAQRFIKEALHYVKTKK